MSMSISPYYNCARNIYYFFNLSKIKYIIHLLFHRLCGPSRFNHIAPYQPMCLRSFLLFLAPAGGLNPARPYPYGVLTMRGTIIPNLTLPNLK